MNQFTGEFCDMCLRKGEKVHASFKVATEASEDSEEEERELPTLGGRPNVPYWPVSHGLSAYLCKECYYTVMGKHNDKKL